MGDPGSDNPVEITSSDVLSYASGMILAGPDDDIWDQIFDWIASSTSTITSTVISWINSAVGWITTNVTAAVRTLVSPVSSWVSLIYSSVTNILTWVYSVYNTVHTLVSTIYSTVSSAATSAITIVHTWLSATSATIVNWITTQVHQVWEWITGSVSNLTTAVKAWFSELWANIGALLSTWGNNIVKWLGDIRADLAGVVSNVFGRLATYFDWLASWLVENIVKPLDAWWDRFLAKVFDFPSWVGKLLDAVADWLTQDIPGSSPRWTKIFSDIGHWFATWFYEFPKWFFGDFPERVAYGLSESWKWASKGLEVALEGFSEAIIGFVKMLGPISPETATANYQSVAKVGLMSIAGLFGMTLAGELLHPLKQLGLGQLSAVIWDATNYKLITGAFLGALAATALRTPLTYYFNDLFRPWLPSPRDQFQMFDRRLITGDEYKKLLGYQGLPDTWHDKMLSLAETPVGYFALANIAKNGVFDRDLFRRDLFRRGYADETVDLLLDMYQKNAMEAVKGAMSGTAITRFKEGFTTEDQFASELVMLGYSDQQIPVYIAGARLAYATDYLSDMKAAYTDAVKKGFISLDDYRSALIDLGIVPERVESFVLRQRIYLQPKEKVTPVSPPTPTYLTDQGKLQADTLRRQRRKNIITRDEEIAGLLGLGMPVDMATATADNDDVRLAEKGTEE